MTDFKKLARQITDNSYAIDQIDGMKVPITAFFSEKLFLASEEEMWAQAVHTAGLEGVVAVHLMPDAHSGFGVPIGSVVVTDGTIIQASIGYDISCGVSIAKINNLTVNGGRSKEKRRRWIEQVEKRIALGMGTHRPEGMPKFDESVLDDVLRHGANALNADQSKYERIELNVEPSTDLKLVERAHERALGQLGSLGGGNHFIEMQADAEGQLWVMVHSGSRGFGYQTAEHFFYAGAELRGMKKNERSNSWLRVDESLGQQFLSHHNAAANYAIANRAVIMSSINEALGEVFNAELEPFYDISHNLVQEETVEINGEKKRLLVHRKGATRALHAGHPDLVGSSWESMGHPIVVPGSMFDGAAILTPLEGSKRTSCSVNHGSGRVMGRKDAKRKLEHKQQRIDDEMSGAMQTFNGTTIEGILTNSRHVPLDECKHVYKDLNEVLKTLEDEKIAIVSKRLGSIAVIKGSD